MTSSTALTGKNPQALLKKGRMVEITDLSKSFYLHQMDTTIAGCRSITFHVDAGEFVGITGRSGSGKSTILKLMYRRYLPQEGRILYRSQAYGDIDLCTADEQQVLYLRRREIAYVSQFLQVIPRTSARQIIEGAAMEAGAEAPRAAEAAQRMLQHFELDRRLWDAYPNTFSGGEKLRLGIARAMATEPRLLLLDEPTASLDNASKIRVRELITRLKEQGTTMIGIFHDLEFMEGLCDRELPIEDGKM